MRRWWLRGTGIEVLEVEPVRRDNPLFTEPHMVLRPHNAGSTEGSHVPLDAKLDPAMMVNPELTQH